MPIKKRVLLITSTFPKGEDDEQIQWLRELILRLKSQGIKIDVFAPAYRGSPSHTYFGIKVSRFRYAPAPLEILTHDEGALFKLRQKPWLFFLPIFYLFFGVMAVIRKAKDSHYDVIHVHWPFPQGIFGLAAKRTTSAKLILTFYGAEFALVNQVPLGTAILRLIIQQADRVVAISNFTKRKILAITKVPVKVIPFVSGISKVSFKKQKIKKTKDKTKRILFVGRLIERKGVAYLIEAMPTVLTSIDARLDIVGHGLLLPKLKRQVEKMGLQKKVFLHGKIDEKKLVNFYQDCHVFVLPAIIDRWGDTEGLGVVLLEAMSFKKPVIASRVGGIGDIVKDGQTGILVPQKDSSSLAEAIIKLLTNKNLSEKLSREGYQQLQDKFRWERIINQVIKIYR